MASHLAPSCPSRTLEILKAGSCIGTDWRLGRVSNRDWTLADGPGGLCERPRPEQDFPGHRDERKEDRMIIVRDIALAIFFVLFILGGIYWKEEKR